MAGKPAAKPMPLYRQLWMQVLAAMVAGVALGHFAPQTGAAMQPLGDAFIKAIRMIIAPIIFCTVVHGIAHMGDMKRVGRVAIKVLVYFEVMTTLALIVALVAVDWWQPGVGMNIDPASLDPNAVKSYTVTASQQGLVPFLMNIIPNTALGAFADGNVLQVLFFAVPFGFALSMLGARAKPLVDVIDVASNALFGVVGIVMKAAPLGAFGAIAFTVGRFGTGSLVSLGALIGEFYLTCLIFIFGVLGTAAWLAGFSLWKLIRYIREELLIVLATTSSEPVMPRLMIKLEQLGCDETVVGLVIPTGYSFNLDGTCLYLTTAAMFLAQATNTHLDLTGQLGLMAVLLLTSKGAAGVAGAAFVVLAATLASLGTIPVASIGLVLGIHRLLSMGLTPTNVIGNSVAAIVVAKWEGALDHAKLRRTLDGETPMPMRAKPVRA